ncbi:hypothetical protein DN752_00715 [Echinicola strongylocentroti]|uniref:Cyclic nucleotide-binding domain-containing protein n=1 Tax=Echinicola strongylocentroti TaxID=1795355 RepID=A0A2Z4ICR3_9BACT|nr:Crp/Fnr family transcriptional regulator [Echinicola strongylocentroti]AWW28771.1 hypothetical protein DN752_00715 [Echinicola strongylocentroti]
MEKLKHALEFGGILSKDDIDTVAGSFQLKMLNPGDHFHRIGKVANEIAFVDHGAIRVYAAEANGTEVTKYFVRPNQFAVELESYYSRQVGKDGIQAVIPTEVYIIHQNAFQQLLEKIPNLFIYFKAVSEAHLLNKITDGDFLNYGSSKTKYVEFLRRYPDLAHQVPLQYIASYLKITP